MCGLGHRSAAIYVLPVHPVIQLDRMHNKLEGKYSLESTDPRESEIRAPPQPLPIPPNTLFL